MKQILPNDIGLNLLILIVLIILIPLIIGIGIAILIGAIGFLYYGIIMIIAIIIWTIVALMYI